MTRIWMVTIPVEIPVIAPDEREAQSIARRHIEEAARWLSPLTQAGVVEITPLNLSREHTEYIPWNAPNDETIGELLADHTP